MFSQFTSEYSIITSALEGALVQPALKNVLAEDTRV
jgi:hypothetical protein